MMNNLCNLLSKKQLLWTIQVRSMCIMQKEAMTLPVAGVRFPVRLQQSIAPNGIVYRFSEKVNMKISDATQSQQFKR